MKSKEIVQKWKHDFQCSLFESIMSDPVEETLREWVKNAVDSSYIIIGGMAVGYYTRPRMTQDIDVLYKHENQIPTSVSGFKKNRPHSFENKKTGVEVEMLSTEFIGQNQDLINKVFDTARIIDGVTLPSPEGLVALKIKRHSLQDIADIDSIAKIHELNFKDWPLDEKDLHIVENAIGYKLKT